SLNARLMGVPVTGNGRRESFAHVVMPRMTNTYMLNGDKDPKEILASVKKGLYAVNFGGGQVDITNGKFVFSASEAYMIEDGKVTHPVKGATLIGNGPDALTRVSMIGNDLALDTGDGKIDKTLVYQNLPSSPLPESTLRYRAELMKSMDRKLAEGAKPYRAQPVFFMAQWCGYCKQAKSYLAEKGISYREYDIDTA